MKTIRTVLLASVMSLATAFSASAHDAFGFGVQIGGYGYAPPPVVHYYPAPTTPYYGAYGAPTYYYGAPIVQHSPNISFHYFDNGRRGSQLRHWNRGHDRGRWGNGGGRWGHDRGHHHDDRGGRRGRDR